jgi:ABC-2 type transport system permease protein
MRWYKIFGISQRILINFFRDPKLLIIAILAPLILILVFSVTYKPEIGDIKIAVVDLDKSLVRQLNIVASLENLLKENIKKANILKYNSLENAKDDFKKNKIDSIIVFPENLDETVFIKLSGIPVEKPAEVILYNDETDKLKSSIISEGLEKSIIKLSQSFGIEPALVASKGLFFNRNISNQDFWNSAIIGFSIFVLSLLFSLSLISNEKVTGLLQSIISCSMSPFEILTGYFIGYLFINFIQIVILLSIYIIIFKGILSISLLFILIFMLFLSISGNLLGILLGNISSSSIRSFQIAVIIMLISLLISGIFWPTSSLPLIGKILSYLFPTSFTIEAIRGIITKENGFLQVLPNFVVLCFFCLFYYFLAVLFIRKTVD